MNQRTLTKQMEVAKALADRRAEGLKLFRPMETQIPILKCTAREMLVRGGNRCQPAETVVWRADGTQTTLGEVAVGDEIMGIHGDHLDAPIVAVTIIDKTMFEEAAIEIETQDGYRTSGTLDHPILVCPPSLSVHGEIPTFELTSWCELWQVEVGWFVAVASPSRGLRWDRITSIREVGQKQIVGIKTTSETYISDGIVSHNSGKSVISAVRFASIATGIPIETSSGELIHCRLPRQQGRCLTMWCIGLGEAHIGQTLYRLLFQKGAFKVIKDRKTKQWRAWNPLDPDDRSRESECRPSPPLIPNRYIDPKGWTWKSKGDRCFSKATIIDPTTKEPIAIIYAFTSSGDVKAGDPVDEIWIDEMIKYTEHYPEWTARLIDRAGRLAWSSWPDVSNSALLSMTKRACEHASDPNAPIKEFLLRMNENPFLPKEAKTDAINSWSAQERRARDDGEYVTDALKMYPRFDSRVHCAFGEDSAVDDNLAKVLRERGGEPPDNWCREIIVDPGTTHPAALFVATPSPEFGDYAVVYDEVFLQNADADQLAKAIARRASGHQFYRFLIDNHAARQTPMGFGKTVLQKYSEAFRSAGLVSRMTGSGFLPGSDNVPGRIGEVQDWMVLRNTGFPKLRIVTPFCKNLCEQLLNYLKDINGTSGVANEYKPLKRQKIDLAVCLEYWAASQPRWVAPPREGKPFSPAERMKRMIDRLFQKKRDTDQPITLGPST